MQHSYPKSNVLAPTHVSQDVALWLEHVSQDVALWLENVSQDVALWLEH